MNFKRKLKRKSKYWNKGEPVEEIIEPTLNENGDEVVELEKDGVKKKFLVAQLVTQSFVPNPDNKKFVRHKDGNKRNNRADNLEWSDTEE